MRRSRNLRRGCVFFPAVSLFHDVSWRPAADIYRTCTGWLVKLDLAGVRPEDIVVQARGGSLFVHGTRRDWLLEENAHYYSLEIAYNRFERRIDLPVVLEHAEIVTEYHAGMLVVRIYTQGERP